MGKQKEQCYYVPELKMDLRVTFITVNRYVADFPGGPERVKESDMKGWVHKGAWNAEDVPKMKSENELKQARVILGLSEALKDIAKRTSCHDCVHHIGNNLSYCTHEKDGCVGSWEFYESGNGLKIKALKALEGVS